MNKNHSLRLESLRQLISSFKGWGFLVPYSNCFQNEYMADCDHRLQWLTGFKGSAGLVIVLANHAALFVDGRYTVQAPQEVETRNFSVEPYSVDSIEKWLSQHSPAGQVLLYDSWLYTVQQISSYKKHLDPLGITLEPCDDNLIDAVWVDRPVRPCEPFVPHPDEFSGKSFKNKLEPILASMKLKSLDYMIMTNPESISWLLNMRSNDTPFTPSCQAFLIIDHGGGVQAFTDLKKVTQDVRNHSGDPVSWCEFKQFLDVVSSFSTKKVRVDFGQLPQKILDCLRHAKAEVLHETDPCILGRALKNDVEQAGAIAAQERDSIAVINFLAWLERSYQNKKITELDTVAELLKQRQKQTYFQGESFSTISAVGPHAAIVHYHPDPLTNTILSEDAIYLLDSGGQYLDGTTDTTRTIALGQPTDEQKDRFTRVLKGHIALASIIFPDGTTGQQLDVLARQFLWHVGLDYEHSTGHGIGSYLNVHEGPQRIGKGGHGAVLQPGMLVTNEPGYYKAGEYGIRIESVLLVIPLNSNFLGFKTLTLIPIDRMLMDVSLLTKQEIEWINAYHDKIFTKLSSKVDEQSTGWLQEATKPIKFSESSLKNG
ncbi:aminopeptidase P family protein [Candidatus Finniella inopinata]|nr:aminopeptidase P family protein [Candidatus Finniella inopinata]